MSWVFLCKIKFMPLKYKRPFSNSNANNWHTNKMKNENETWENYANPTVT